MRKKEDFNNAMRLESYDLQRFAGELYALNGERVLNSLPDSVFLNASHVIATGCGDSYCAALAAQPAFRALAGVPMVGLPAIDLARHYPARELGQEAGDPLVFAISSRGKTSRVIEAARRANRMGKGAETVAIVNFKVRESLLEKECKHTLYVEMPEFQCGEHTEHAPCQRSYFSTMFTLLLMAVKMGEVRGRYDAAQAEVYRQGMIEYAEKFNNALMDSIDERMWKLANEWLDLREYEVLASGDDYPNAWFGAAKVIEAFGDIATYEKTENWQSICAGAKNPERIGTIVIVDRDNENFAAAVKTVAEMVKIGRPTIVITDAEADVFDSGAEVFTIPTTAYRWAKPLMQYAPLGNLMGYISRMRGANFYRYGDSIWDDINNIGEAILDDPITVVK